MTSLGSSINNSCINVTGYLPGSIEGKIIGTSSAEVAFNISDMDARIDRIEKLLGTPTRKPKLERLYPDLKTSGERMDLVIAELYWEYITTVGSIVNKYDEHATECMTMEILKPDDTSIQP
jgi:hypothetical protein